MGWLAGAVVRGNYRRWGSGWMMCVVSAAVVLLANAGELAGSTTFTVTNKCSYTVWPGVSPDAGQPALAGGGFELAPGQSSVLSPPAGWSGRLWGRTGCAFGGGAVAAGPACATGDCGGAVACGGASGAPPVTLAEFTLGAPEDFYDVSLVDGYNLPLAVVAAGGSGGCGTAACGADLLTDGACPAQLQLEAGGAGQVVACKSACDAFNDPQYCCTGAYSSPQTCGPSAYSQLFKSACPSAYSYAYDDPSSTFTCSSPSDYSITFCPN